MSRTAKMLRSLRPIYFRAASVDFKIPHLMVRDLDESSCPRHVETVHHSLEDAGILKISLGFSDTSSKYLQSVISHLHKWHGHGLPITHNAHQGWFWDIRPSQTIFQCPGHQARSETMNEFPWHTDCSYESTPPRFFALQVLQHDRCGGGTLSVLKLDPLLALLSPSSLISLSRPEFQIQIPPEFIKSNNAEGCIVGSLLAPGLNSHSLYLRFREDIIVPLTGPAGNALKELKQIILSPQAQRTVLNFPAQDLPQGSILLMDNRRWLHGRNQVNDPRRYLKRVRWDAQPFL